MKSIKVCIADSIANKIASDARFDKMRGDEQLAYFDAVVLKRNDILVKVIKRGCCWRASAELSRQEDGGVYKSIDRDITVIKEDEINFSKNKIFEIVMDILDGEM